MIQETSQLAFQEVLPTLSDRHQKVLQVLSTVPDATNSELSRMLGWEINRVTPRVNELVNLEKPLIEQARKRSCKITGRTAIAWRVTRKEKSIVTNFRCSHPTCSKDAIDYQGNEPRCPQHLLKQVNQVALL